MFKNAAQSRGPFVEESDGEDVASNTTEDSEQQEIYSVDEILAEDPDYEGTGEMMYLLKWTGYPVARASWEPKAHIETPSVLSEWAKRKRSIRKGEIEAFDVADWEAKKLKLEEEKLERARLRKAKRKKRGMAVSSSDEAYEANEMDVDGSPARRRIPRLESDDNEITSSKPARRRKSAQASLVKRKGVAQKVSTTSPPTDSSSDEEEINDRPQASALDSDLRSVFEKGSRPIYPDLKKPSAPAIGTNMKAASPMIVKSAVPQKAATVVTSRQPASNTVTGTAKRTKPSEIFTNFSSTKAKARQRVRVSGETPKDSAAPRFKKLAVQNRLQKRSRNEPAPDINALKWVDPKAGTVERLGATPISATTSASRAPGDIHSALGRDRSLPRPERRGSTTHPSPEPPRAVAAEALASYGVPHPATIAQSGRRRTETCWNWQFGSCRFTAATCNFAHYTIVSAEALPPFAPTLGDDAAHHTSDTPSMPAPPSSNWVPPAGMWAPKKETTCYYWLGSGCQFPEEGCEFAHRFTGTFPRRALLDTDLVRKVTEMKNTTCRFWEQGTCNLPEEQCNFAHRHFERDAVRAGIALDNAAPVAMPLAENRANITCFFWDKGNCRRGDDCSWAHRFTGTIANPPPGFTGQTAPMLRGMPPANMSPLTMSTSDADASHAISPAMDRTMRFQLPENDVPPSIFETNIDQGVVSSTVELVSGSAGERVKVQANLHVSGIAKVERLFFPIHNGIYLMPDSMMTAMDVQTYLAHTVQHSAQWPTGSVVPVRTSTREADAATECCRLYASGFISVQEEFTLLIYPARDDAWRFLERPNAPTMPNAPLRFHFLPPVEGMGRKQTTPESAKPMVSQRPSVIAVTELLNIDARKLLEEREGRPPNTSVFLAWPEDHEAEMQLLVKCYQDLKCKVYHSGTPGAWQYYRRKYYKSCLILAHPETPLWEMPRLHALLQFGGVRVVSVGLQRLSHQSLEEPLAYGYERLFPLGQVWFITDDVFVSHPEKASQVIQRLLSSNESKPLGSRNDKIAARPGVRNWLQQLAIERTTERGRSDNRWLQLYYDICRLCPLEDEDPFDLPNPSQISYLVSLPPEEFPGYAELWEHDQEKATETMVEWFAGWSVLNARRWRKFVVCHEPQKGTIATDENGNTEYQLDADERGWSGKWHHIDVQRPEQLVSRANVGK